MEPSDDPSMFPKFYGESGDACATPSTCEVDGKKGTAKVHKSWAKLRNTSVSRWSYRYPCSFEIITRVLTIVSVKWQVPSKTRDRVKGSIPDRYPLIEQVVANC